MSVEITSVSWIDRQNLPSIGLGTLLEATTHWESRTVIGLVATSNPRPPESLDAVSAFQKTKQYRALESVTLDDDLTTWAGPGIMDAGWTPPFDKSKLPFAARLKPPPASALKWHEGETSPFTSICVPGRHSASAIDMPANAEPLMNMMIKFRAGKETNDIGLSEAKSPYHVPWVWCETLLIRVGGQVKLMGRGSQFPSHAWYVNGKRVMMNLQTAVTASKKDPALSTGRPESQPRQSADRDDGDGQVQCHPFTVSAGLTMTEVLGRGHLGVSAGS